MVEEKNGKLVCEGGSLECTGHRLEVCMIDKDRNDVVKYLGSIAVRAQREFSSSYLVMYLNP
jgi:hypothetical protein